MLTRRCALMLFALWLPLAQAQPDTSLGTPAAAAQPKHGFMWEARNGEQRVVLMGTIHVGRPGFQPPNDDFLARLARADAIAVEVDLSEAARVGPLVQKIGFYAAGSPGLDTRFPQLKASLQKLMQRYGLAPQTVLRMKPWMAANTFGLAEAARAGLDAAYATEAFLFSYAREHGKELVEIESVEEQLRLFDSAPESVQLAYLRRMIEGIDDGSYRNEMTSVVAAWDRGDSGAMDELVARMQEEDGVAERFSYDQLLVGRHRRMLAAIERFAASGRQYVVAVGSLHFFGRGGLLDLLKQRGFTISRV
jgi:uncharacterized protein YbaP (TraB family)